MSALKAVTFDFWNTLVDGTPTPAGQARRMAQLHQHIAESGLACSADELRHAFRRMVERVDTEARENLKDIGPPGRWTILAAELGIADGAVSFEVFERAYAAISLEPLVATMPHVEVAVESMKRAGYRLGVICNTGMTGGQTLREVLRRHALLEYFDTTVFSNEFGWSKPDPRIFEHAWAELGGIQPHEALHVGDIEGLDIEGARRARSHAALYAPSAGAPPETHADFVVADWRDFAAQVETFAGGLTKPTG